MHLLVALLLIGVAAQHTGLVNGQCTPEPVQTSSFFIEPWTQRYIEVDEVGGVPQTSLDTYIRSEHQKFFYTTQFFDCGDNQVYMSVKSLNTINNTNYYLANTQVNSPADLVDLLPVDDSPFLSRNDPRLFRYTGGAALDLTLVESQTQYVSSQNTQDLVYNNQERFWSTWPFITRTFDRGIILTVLAASFRVSGQDVGVFVYFSSPSSYDLISNSSYRFSYLTNTDLNFEIITWRMYLGFDTVGGLDTAGALVLKRPNDNRYLTIDIDNGVVPLPRQQCIVKYRRHHYRWTKYRYCYNYQVVKYRYYDDASRSRGSTFAQSAIREQNTVDERFFEAIDDMDGTHRMRSVLDPRVYLAIAKAPHNKYRLVVMEARDDVDGLVNYKFNINVPPLADEVMLVPRLPCTSSTIRTSLFTCLP